MSYTNECKRAGLTALSKLFAVAMILLNLTSLCQAQQTFDLDSQITEAKDFLLELDVSARVCLDDAADGESCDRFRQAISTQQLSTYQSLCEPLVAWREQLITSSDTIRAEENPELTLERLLGVEFACGNKALVARTEHVAKAFAFIQNPSPQTSLLIPSDSMNRVERDSYGQRRSVFDSVDRSRLRLQQETDLQWRRLELENTLRLQQQLQVDLRNPGLP